MPGQESQVKNQFHEDNIYKNDPTDEFQMPSQLSRQPLFERVQFGLDWPVQKLAFNSTKIINKDMIQTNNQMNQATKQPLFEQVQFGVDKPINQQTKGKSYWKSIKEKFIVNGKEGLLPGETDTMVRDIWVKK